MQPHFYSRALSLAALDAPSEAKAMALLLSWHKDKEALACSQASRYLHMCEAAAATHPHVVLPEIHKILDLEGSLPHAIRSRRLSTASNPVSGPAATAADPELTPVPGPDVEWPLEGLTPWIRSSASFREAAAFSDNPERWHEAAAQVDVRACEDLNADGARWRKRLTKRTDFGMPFTSDLVAEDTIDITAEGHDARDGSGFRRYSYILHSAAGVPGVLDIKRDEGWIEIAGDANGVQIRIQKRVTVVRPSNDELACILSAGFLAELWLWAIGFGGALGKPGGQTVRVPLVQKPKKIPRLPPSRKTHRVCVMGGGPAGLACAWLLKNPRDAHGKPAWTGKAKVEVGIVEKGYLPGGKAASGRRVDKLQYRIEEHGLHMALGCYPNLLKILEWTKGMKNLEPVRNVVIPCGTDPRDVDDAFSIQFKPWVDSATSQPGDMKNWIRQEEGARRTNETAMQAAIKTMASRTGRTRARARVRARKLIQAHRHARTLWQSIGEQDATVASTRQRPIMRLCAAANDMLADRLNEQGAICTRQHLSLVALGKAVSLAGASEIALGAAAIGTRDVGVAANELVALATLMRSFARAALPWDKGDAKARLTGEMLEFATTVIIGLAADAAVPMWALDQPNQFVNGPDYAQWVRLVQQNLDKETLADWLNKHGVAPGFALHSRVIGAVTAGLFTGADGIAAGTFVNGFLRLLLTYQDAPFYRFKVGTGQAVIAPIFDSLKNWILMEGMVQHIEIKHGVAVSIDVGASPAPTPAPAGGVAGPLGAAGPGGDFRAIPTCGNDPAFVIRTGPLPPVLPRAPRVRTIRADAFVLAIPPFDQPIPGLPTALADELAKIRHTATISLQCWTSTAPKLPASLVAGSAAPFRCLASMGMLMESGGNPASPFDKSPVYYCGELSMEEESIWGETKFTGWIQDYASIMQRGPVLSSYGRVNATQSERYVLADPATQKARLYVFDTDVDNLWLAGDWTRTALSCGSIEAAITSGLEAAREILRKLGCTVNFPIVGSILDDPA